MGKKEKPDVIVKEGAPAWMVSFSDLNTLLLTFFILLLVFAKQRQYGLIDSGLGSFQKAFVSNGLNGIFRGRTFPILLEDARAHFKDEERQGKLLEERDRGDEVGLGKDAEGRRTPGEAGKSIDLPLAGPFPPGSAVLPMALRRELARLAGRLRGEYRLVLAATAGAGEGRELRPDRLALKRALAAARELHGLGVPWERMEVEGKVVRGGTEGSGMGAERSMKITVVR